MAKDPPKTAAGISFGPPTAKKNRPKQKRQAAGLTTGKPSADDVVVRPTYGLVFDPSGMQSEILSNEQKAARDLYLRRVGSDAGEAASAREMLESAGYINPATQRTPKRRPDGEKPVYASAADALDAIERQVTDDTEWLYGNAKRFLTSEVPGSAAANRFLGRNVGKAVVGGLGVLQPYTLLGTTETGRRIAGALDETPIPLPGLRQGTTVGEGVSAAKRGVEAFVEPLKPDTETQMTRGTVRKSTRKGRPLQDVVFGALGDVRSPIPSLAGLRLSASSTGQLATPTTGQPSLRELQSAFGDMAARPNRYIDAGADDKTVIPNASPVVAAGIGLANDGVTAPEIQTALEQSRFDGLSPNEDRSLRERARKAGHDVADWDTLLAGEKIARAYTTSNYAIVTMRNAFRAIGATGATPAGVKAIGDAAFSALRGDTEEGSALISGIIDPYAYAKDVAARDGLAAGLAVAFRDNPIDVALAFNAALRGAGRVGGIAARSGRLGERAAAFAESGRAVSVQRARPRGDTGPVAREETPLLPGPFRYEPGQGSPVEQYNRWQARGRQMQAENAEAIDEAVAAGRVDEQGVPYAITRTPISKDLLVGYTTPNLTSGISLAIKGRLASNWNRYANKLETSTGARYTRTQANIADGVAVEIEKILTDALGRAPTDAQKARAAWDLSRPQTLFEGEVYTPRTEADFYRGEIRKLMDSAEYRKDPELPDFKQQIARWEAAIKELDKLDEVEIDADTTARIREAARPLGEENTRLIAAALGVTTKEAKRADYIRLLVVDPRFDAAARALKAEKNVGKQSPKALIASQKRIRALSQKIQKRVTTRGVGKKSAPKSRVAFAALRDQMVTELRRAERAALEIGDEALATQYREARASFVLARASAPERAAALANQIAAIGRLEARAEDLPAQARPAYQAAQEAMRAEDAAERESIAATTRQRQALAAAGVGAANRTALEAAEAAAERARRAYELDRESTMLSPDQVEASRLAVTRAEERLASLQEAQAATTAGMEAREALRAAIGRRESAVREAQNIIRRNAPVLDTGQVRVALDEAGQLAAVRVRRKKDYGYYTLERARGEVLDSFIARAEANDDHAILHLVQKGAFVDIGDTPVVSGVRLIDAGPRGRIRSGRLKSSKGQLFYLGGEDFSKMWRNLMFDTSELQSANGWRKKMQQLIEATSIKVSVTEGILRASKREAQAIVRDNPDLVFDEVMRQQVLLALRADSFEFSLGDFELINPVSPKARMPRKREATGSVFDQDTVAEFLWREVSKRTIDPNAPGDYYLVPRALYQGIQKSLRDEAFRFRPSGRKISGYNLDRLMRAWRTLTLNVLPKTAFANIVGSAILALQGGAGPRSWYMAWRALTGRVDPNTGRPYPIPKELLQRYYDQFTPEVGQGGRLLDEPTPVQAGAAWVAWWMNSMRRLNGMSEDFGRLAVWYSKAVPEALAREERGVGAIMARAKRLNDDAMDLLESMANNEAEWAAKNDMWLRQSYDFLGYLHRGGEVASWLRIGIPFWQWYVHMLKLTFATMPVKYPGRALFLQQLGEIGDEYQRTHGVIIPWGGDIIPLWESETEVINKPQFVTTGIGSSSWYPQGTVANIADREGNLNIAGYVRGSINPQITNSFLILMTLGVIGGVSPAFEFSDYTGLKAARNEYGNEIDEVGIDLVNYWANRAGQMMPLAPTVMSLAGRPADSTLWNLGDRKQNGPAIPPRRTDLITALEDPWGPNVLTFLLKAMTGMQFTDVPGMGPVERARIRKLADYEARNASREERNIAEKILQRQSAGNVAPAQLTPARPGGTEQ